MNLRRTAAYVYLRRVRLFLSLVWRPDFTDGRISVKCAWEVACIIWSDEDIVRIRAAA